MGRSLVLGPWSSVVGKSATGWWLVANRLGIRFCARRTL